MPRAELFSEPRNVIGRASIAPTEPYKLHIGCGVQRLADYLNCDLYETSATDRIFDCTERWPFENDTVSTIYCSHTLEHLQNFKGFFREAWRVLRPDGNLQIRVPYGGHKAAYWDIEHVRPWYAESFCFLQPGYAEAIGNSQHHGWRHFFSVEDVVLRLSGRLIPVLRWKWARRFLLPCIEHIQNAIEEMWVYLIPLKTLKQIEDWQVLHPGNCIPSRYSVYRHHLERRPLGAHEVSEFVDWRRDMLWNGFHAWLGR